MKTLGHENDKLLFMEAPAPLLITSNRYVKNCNNAFVKLFGYAREDLIGELAFKLYPTPIDYHKIGKQIWDCLQTHDTYEDERFMQHKNKEVFWAKSRGVTLTPKTPFRFIIWHFERAQETSDIQLKLTPREREICSYIVNGITSRDTGKALKISHRTVELHRSRIFKKLEVKNAVDLISRIVQTKGSFGS